MESLKAILRADSVGRRFGARQVLSAATLYAYSGRITVLLGRNGCGKSTLLRIIAGQIRADYGAVHFAGRVHLRPQLARLAQHGLFYIPERGLLSPYLTVKEHLQMAGAGSDLEAAIRRMNLADLLGHSGRQLSPGERRRADLALALMRAPTCMLADEIFMGIAPLDAERISDGVRSLSARGAAVIVTGHEIGPLLELADEIVWMTSGTTHLLGSVSAARRHHQFAREYLGQA